MGPTPPPSVDFKARVLAEYAAAPVRRHEKCF
jgi:hypothetical protein